MNIFAQRLKESRISKSLSQKALAEMLNVKQEAISQWENSKRQPSYELLVLICQHLDCSADYLLGLTDY